MQTLLLIDAHALIYRFFYALPPLTTPDGKPIQAIYGLSGTLIKILTNLKPSFAAAAFDRPEQTFRKAEFAEYKIHRPPVAEELVSQFSEAKNAFRAFGIPVFEKPGYEADDLIGTLSQRFASSEDIQIVILSGDLDILQLVDGTRVIADIVKTGISNIARYTEHEVIERYELSPKQLPDYKGLVGDASDNIPGVTGIGQKTARELLKEWGTLEEIYENVALVKSAVSEKLTAEKDRAFLSKRLATIDRAVPVDIPPLEQLRIPPLTRESVSGYLSALGFQSLIERLGRNDI
jgi:DNA polymerase-1